MNLLKYKKLLSEITPAKGTLLAIVLFMTLESALSLMTPWLAGQFTHVVLSHPSSLALTYQQILLLWLFLLVLQAIISSFLTDPHIRYILHHSKLRTIFRILSYNY